MAAVHHAPRLWDRQPTAQNERFEATWDKIHGMDKLKTPHYCRGVFCGANTALCMKACLTCLGVSPVVIDCLGPPVCALGCCISVCTGFEPLDLFAMKCIKPIMKAIEKR